MSYLLRDPRTGVYYHRRVVPVKLRAAVGAREIKKSLGTKDPKEAKRRNQEVGSEVARTIQSAQDSLSGPAVVFRRMKVRVHGYDDD